MVQTNTLLELRSKIKDKKPDFIRQDYQRRKRLGRKLKWKKPKGIHSKIRHKFKGWRKMPSPGYKSPRKVKGMHSSGLKTINIFSVDDLTKIKKENKGIILSKNVGIKKRYEILKKAKELDVTVLNLNVDEQIKKIENFINSKKSKSKKETKKDKSKEKSAKQTKEQKEQESQKLSDEAKREAEKKEKDKLLIKKT